VRLALTLVLMALAAASEPGAGICGRWSGTGELKTPDGNTVTQPFWAEFRQDGQKVTGSAGGGDMEESVPIENGSFDGKRLTFHITGPKDGLVYQANLTLDGARLEGTLQFSLPDGTPAKVRLVLRSDQKR